MERVSSIFRITQVVPYADSNGKGLSLKCEPAPEVDPRADEKPAFAIVVSVDAMKQIAQEFARITGSAA